MEEIEVKYIFDGNNKSFNDCIIDIFKSYLILNNFNDSIDINTSDVIMSITDVHDHI